MYLVGRMDDGAVRDVDSSFLTAVVRLIDYYSQLILLLVLGEKRKRKQNGRKITETQFIFIGFISLV